MAKTLDKIVDRETNKNNSSKESGLARILNNPKRGLLGKVFDYSVAITATAVSYAAIGPTALLAAATSNIGDLLHNEREKVKTTSAQVRDSTILGTLWAIPFSHAFNLMNSYINVKTWAGKGLRAVAQLVAIPFTLGYAALWSDYVIRHKKFEGSLKKQVKPFFWKNYRDRQGFLSVPNMAMAYYGPPQLHYPASLVASMLGRTFITTRTTKALDPYHVGYNNNKKS